MYVKHFGRDYVPDDYIQDAYKRARNHKWYMTARMITVHDIYSFDPSAVVSWEPFIDIVGRHFKQPAEGLGFRQQPDRRTCGAPSAVRQSIFKAGI